jgi:hypothetical protein
MALTQLQQSEQFIDYVIGGKQWLAILPHPRDRGRMVWITPYKIGKPTAGIYKHRHGQRP